MNPDEKRLLERTAVLAEENNKILKGIRRSARLGKFLHMLYWVLIIGASVATYYYIQPYIETAKGIYDEAKKTIENVRDTSEGI